MTGRGFRIVGVFALGLWLVAGGAGCGARFVPYAASNTERGVSISPSFLTRVFRPDAGGAADIFLTDLPRERLRPGAPLNGVSGHLVRVSLFLRPVPGKTPIDSTAINAAVMHVVVADGRVGVYAGAGFMSMADSVEAASIEGRLRGGSLRLVGAMDGFVDLLGSGTVEGSVSAAQDAPMAALLRARLDELVKMAGVSPD